MRTVRFILLAASVAFIGVGGYMYPPLGTYLRKDDTRPVASRTIYWRRGRFTPDGQRLVTRAWVVQGTGLALLMLTLFLR